MNTITALKLAEGLAQFTQTYLPAQNYAAKTRQEYGRDIAELVSFLSDQGIRAWPEVTLKELQGYMAELDRRKLKASSRNRKAHTLRTFFRFLVEFGYADANPAADLKPPKIPAEERRFLEEAEYNAVLAQVTSSRDRAILMLLLQTGLRLSELASLTADDLELPKRVSKRPEDVGSVKTTRKRGKVERIPLNWKAVEALKAWLKERTDMVKEHGLTTEALFLSKFKTPLTPRSIQRLVKKYLDLAGIQGATTHTLRHTAATHYLARGGDLKSVQALLGHANIKSTAIYVGLAKQAQKQMVQELAL